MRYHGGDVTQRPANDWRIKVKAVQGPATDQVLRTPRGGPADSTWPVTGLGQEDAVTGNQCFKAWDRYSADTYCHKPDFPGVSTVLEALGALWVWNELSTRHPE